MITRHSIDLETVTEQCFAKSRMQKCKVLSATAKQCDYRCDFYKPKGCRDWIRVKDKDGTNLVPPEEYREFRRRKK